MTDGVYKVLIVDDEEPVRRALERLVERFDQFKMEVSTAENAIEALDILEKQDILRKHKFDIILSDFKMPGMDGVELLSIVKEKYPQTSRILITGYADINIAMEAINKSEVHSYIEKPWEEEELKQSIFKAIDRIKSEGENNKQVPYSPLEQVLQSADGRYLLDTLLELDGTQTRIHTIVEKTEDVFPEVEDIDGKLKVLFDYKLIEQEKGPPILFKCPSCSSYDYRLTPICPFCSSENLGKGEAVEHYKCSKVNFYNKFVKGERLVCPDCDGELKQLGVDYQKISNWILCKECNEYFGEPNLQFFCNDCNMSYTPNQAIWEKENKIVTNKKRIREVIQRVDIITEFIDIFESRNMYVLSNSEILFKGNTKRFDIIVYKKRSDYINRGSEPIFIADCHVATKGILSEKIKLFSTKINGLPYKNIFFMGAPFLSRGSKDICKKLGIEYLEVPKVDVVRRIIEKIIPVTIDNEEIQKVMIHN